jgi:hypothetical protein
MFIDLEAIGKILILLYCHENKSLTGFILEGVGGGDEYIN